MKWTVDNLASAVYQMSEKNAVNQREREGLRIGNVKLGSKDVLGHDMSSAVLIQLPP